MRAALALAATAPLLLAAAPTPVAPAELSATVRTLASDAFGGRAPGTPGEAKTIDYLVGRLRRAGLQPAGPGGAWTQPVPLIHNVAGTPETLALTVGGKPMPLVPGRDVSPGTARAGARIAVDAAPLVFVGYGVSAPERGWDDFKGVDLHGKVAVFLVNDPDFEAKPGDDAFGKFGGQAMTYYGRWTYKYEEAARRGAVAALIVHEDAPAGYGWNVASTSAGGIYALPVAAGQPQPVALQSWLSLAASQALFRAAGLDLAALKVQARSKAFRPVPIGDATLTAAIPVTSDTVESRNVLAKIPGAKHPQETVLFGAHWDAYGEGKPDAEGRTIRPGANDDALGVAGLLALAERFAKGARPDRTIGFGFWTAEERGLLGSEYNAQHPTFAPETTVAALTIDILQTAGKARDLVLIGAGQDSLDADIAAAAKAQGRTVTPDAKPERGLFYRADDFSLAKRGVPTLLMMGAGGGADLVKGGRAAGDRWVSDYTAHCYHQTCDRWSAAWDLTGAAQDVDAIGAVGWRLANSRAWPSWNAASEFRAVREKSAAARR